MSEFRSVLWVGRADESAYGALTAHPTLDVAWVRDVDDALALPLRSFHSTRPVRFKIAAPRLY